MEKRITFLISFYGYIILSFLIESNYTKALAIIIAIIFFILYITSENEE